MTHGISPFLARLFFFCKNYPRFFPPSQPLALLVGINGSWQSWYRHITLCMVAMAFLAVLRLSSQTLETPIDHGKEQPKQITEQNESSCDSFAQIPSHSHLPMMIPFSIPEIQKLFYYIISSKPLSTLYRVAWSLWRRTHQAWARFYHYRLRILDSPSYLQL